ncbi:hypothetical protein RRG08_002913 [Elysia crispata]|uniref:Uncharacterized protein n=1 Tax=Elysia crispata TaxID=231223 RepID=A0AAE1APD9_9GAST|nr:hypothetical protein RRG08_002913 [Elysia crispata]
MNAAVNKLKKDIWKDEVVDEDQRSQNFSQPRRFRIEGRTRRNIPGPQRRVAKDEKEKAKDTKAESKGKKTGKPVTLQALRDALIKEEEETKSRTVKEQKSKQIDAEVLQTLEQVQPVMQMQQTAVSKIRRSIFKLPVSSPYTQYYPPEEEQVQAEASAQKQGETTGKSENGNSSSSQSEKTVEKKSEVKTEGSTRISRSGAAKKAPTRSKRVA